MTALEMEAANIVNEVGSNGSDVECNDENRHEEILESRKARRAVSVYFQFLICDRASRCTISWRGKSKLKCAAHSAAPSPIFLMMCLTRW
jgi:hypothetical protein